MKAQYWIGHWRWKLADHLSWMACKLRGHEWRQLSSNYPGLYGNKAADLSDRIWQLSVLMNHEALESEYAEELQSCLKELGRLAGENWGHRP